jgi:hypothetical protein
MEHRVHIGVRLYHGPNPGNLEWRPRSQATLTNNLHHPLYAGAYSYGRRSAEGWHGGNDGPKTDPVHRRRKGEGVLLRDWCPAYITWERAIRSLEPATKADDRRGDGTDSGNVIWGKPLP